MSDEKPEGATHLDNEKPPEEEIEDAHEPRVRQGLDKLRLDDLDEEA